MARRQSQVMEMLCAAIEMEEKEHTFFKAAADECPNELGKEVFLAILKGESGQKEGIQKIKAAIETNGKWPDTCTLYERKQMDVREMFFGLAQKYCKTITEGASVTDALEVGIGIESAAMDFYARHLESATDSHERIFLGRMLEEERAHHGILLDMQYYYQDPGGFFMEKEHRGLDGA